MSITPREIEVLHGLKNGRAAREIAGVLGISERTVKFHTRNILRKLKVKNRIEAVVRALEEGLLP